MPSRSPGFLLACAVATISLGVSACGSDDGASSTTTTEAAATTTTASASEPADAALTEYCAAVAEVNSTEGVPSREQLEAYADVAPDEVQEPVATFLEVLEANDDDFMAAASDPEGAAAVEEITAFEEETCEPTEDEPDQDPSITQIDPAASRVDVTTADYSFDFDAPTEPGRYSFVSTNDGEEEHVMILLRLDEGVSVDQALESQGEEGVAEEFESEAAPPGGEMVVTADLAAGNWVLLCPIPDAEGTPHFAHGMIQEFTIG